VARNPGSAKKATSYAERLRVGIAVIHGEVKESESDEVDGRYSPPTVDEQNASGGASAGPSTGRRDTLKGRIMDVADTVVGMPSGLRKEKPPLTVVGDVSGRVAIMVDDMIDDASAFVAAAEALKERGASRIYILCNLTI